LPKTASQVPLIALFGVMLISFGLILKRLVS
jgi:LPXTG-motif cell wall-anchored protein